MKREGSPGVPDAGECLEVARVAETSVASYAGIRAGDLLQSVGGRPATVAGLRFLQSAATERRYQFYSPASGERLRMEVSGIELGLELRVSAAALLNAAAAAPPDAESLRLLWESGKWAGLEKLCRRLVGPKPGLLRRLLGKTPQRDTPALLLLGAALYELGKKKEGLELVNEYDRRFSRRWGTEFMAISRYVHARQAFARKKDEEALEHLKRSYELYPLGRIADALADMTGTRPERAARWQGRVIPLKYELPPVDGYTQSASLSAALETLAPGQLFGLCFLGGLRASAAYNDFMLRWTSHAQYFADYLPGLHVLTKESKRPGDRPEWMKAEDTARLRNVPFTVLHDRTGEANELAAPLASPGILLLDRDRKVVYEGELSGADLWDAIATAMKAAAAAGSAADAARP